MRRVPGHTSMIDMKRLFTLLLLLGSALPAMAHPAAFHAGGPNAATASGFLHPFTGPDHLLVMVAVGLWAVQLGGRALWMLPCAFILPMILGALAGIGSMPRPMIEHGIGASMLLLGAALGMAWKPRLSVALAVVVLSGAFHGFAHGSEMPRGVAPGLFLIGMVAATVILQAVGILFATTLRGSRFASAIRAAGCGLIAVAAYSFIPAA